MRTLLVCTLLVLAGCVSNDAITKKYVDMCVGKHIDQAVSQYGPPHSSAELSKGKVSEWKWNGGVRGQASNFGGSTFVSANQAFCNIRLTSDENGTITYVAWQGNSCG